MSAFADLQTWYRAQCDGVWEHNHGIVIETLDNPGWWVKIDLRHTLLELAPYTNYRLGHAEQTESWISCEKRLVQWHGIGDPGKLEEIIERFVRWAQDRPDWLSAPDEDQLQQVHDDQLWEHLGHARGVEKCMAEGCDEFRIRHSKYCRAHHWKYVLHRPART